MAGGTNARTFPLHDAVSVLKGHARQDARGAAAEAAKRADAALRANRRRFAANVPPIIEEIMRAGVTSHNAIAQKLNERNVKTAHGGVWTHVQVGAILHPFELCRRREPIDW